MDPRPQLQLSSLELYHQRDKMLIFPLQMVVIPAGLLPRLTGPIPSGMNRHAPLQMGGLTGLPRIPARALPLTKKWNPSGAYSERIATLWRDLETLYGVEDIAGLGGSRSQAEVGRFVDSGVKTGKFRGFTYSVDLRQGEVFDAVKKVPTLLNPAVSNRFELARAKAVLVDTLGSQRGVNAPPRSACASLSFICS